MGSAPEIMQSTLSLNEEGACRGNYLLVVEADTSSLVHLPDEGTVVD
jgi:hypothetical protein